MLRRLLPFALAALVIVPGAAFLVPRAIPALAAPAATDTVVVTPTGKKYHREGCRTLARSKRKQSVSRAEAERRGLGACKVCKP